tara:strand:+ start:471 stop:917 length:447 start_codon:yes stop_codon:yes gene_type:complete
MSENNIKSWFEEAKAVKVYQGEDHEFSIIKGFKVTHYFEDDSYTILDTRLSDFYTKVTKAHKDILCEKGFIKGTSIIMHSRNIKRVNSYLRLIEGLYSKITQYKKSMQKDKVFYRKRIVNCRENIHRYHDLLQFYKSKADQFKKRELN